jgi:hypothetical protein
MRVFMLMGLAFLLPWMGVFVHGSDDIHQDDGPVALFLLSATTIGMFAIFVFYGSAMVLLSRFQASRILPWSAVALLLPAIVLCVGLLLIWGKVSLDGEWLFVAAAVGYVMLCIRLLFDMALIIRRRKIISRDL